MTVINKGNAPHYLWGDVCEAWKLINGQDLSILHERMPPFSSESRHYHVHSHQFFFVLEGEAIMESDGSDYIIRKHEGIEIPAGVPHCIRNDSEADVEFLVISNPKAHGDRVLMKKVRTITAVSL
ncbi:cupin domain-containing protein [Fictibacillus aquaticus]|uniref:Cupin n=1 Tax=Fictibacillus aquaticus TaxID=2021314 RepID=A0A235FEI3_9BACL|nr:cupin domain-containing protein [Fictibacillus aquaticus]OYD59175.1 cupin [Fictibacillus aquaticus]